ncbi:unnamed protein product [Blepharisma stoltei]|uniref:TNFR-Cys domain-containing protein n=1 Tax=Blepharisma stoltei TaxID=1481888 RepID=A0AAU9JWX3_9CILI|nr:unnamed protein product [Blepharisma stoltei]
MHYKLTSSWHTVSMIINQSTCDTVNISFYINGIIKEARVPNLGYTWTIGKTSSGNSFRGVIYWLQTRAECAQSTDVMTVSNNCVDNQYLDGSSCQNCGKNCSTWPWCARGTDCLTCEVAGCITCEGYPPLKCINCKRGVIPDCDCPEHSTLDTDTNTCVADDGFYFDSDTTCAKCDSQCKKCETSSTNCAICKDFINMSSSTLPGICKCNPGFYWNTIISTTNCQVCDPKCFTCKNSSANCLACKDSNHMDLEFGCSCSPNMFFDGISSCIACDINCATCFGSSTNCLSCKSQYYLRNNGDSNICVSCENPSQGYPEFLCGSQTEGSCSSSKIGFNLEFDNGVITVNFAYNLTKVIQKKKNFTPLPLAVTKI